MGGARAVGIEPIEASNGRLRDELERVPVHPIAFVMNQRFRAAPTA
jgi:hypothetical protein